jgi:hypothetical protein
MGILEVDLQLLMPAERRDLANALLRAAWSATLAQTRMLLLDLLIEVDDAAIGARLEPPGPARPPAMTASSSPPRCSA